MEDGLFCGSEKVTFFFFSSRRRHTRLVSDWSSDVCSSDLHPKGAYFTRGSGHNKFGKYTEIPDEYQEVVDRLTHKHKSAARYVPAPEIRLEEIGRASCRERV